MQNNAFAIYDEQMKSISLFDNNQINLDIPLKPLQTNSSPATSDVPHTNSKKIYTTVEYHENDESISTESTEAAQTVSICGLNRKFVSNILKIVLAAGWIVYLAYAIEIGGWKKTTELVVITSICIVFTVWSLFKKCLGKRQVSRSVGVWVDKRERWVKLVVSGVLLCAAIGWVTASLVGTNIETTQWISLCGYLLIPTIFYVFSFNRSKVQWRPVVGGFTLQLLMALFVLKTDIGEGIFEFTAKFMQSFLSCIDEGSIFLFGETYKDHVFAFNVLPIIIFFSSVVSILYYIGAMRWIITKIGWLMFSLLGTSATESMVAAGNIFVGQTESPLLVKPYLKYCTNSEILTIMAAGMATIAGSVLGAYLSFGVDGVYLITGSVMAAPAVLALSKLFYPQIQKSKFTDFSNIKVENDEEITSLIDAMLRGATQAVPLIANIAACLLAILSIVEGLDRLLLYLGTMIDISTINGSELSIALLFSYLFWPVTYMLGVELIDVTKAAELIGTKVILNEFIAYGNLQVYSNLRTTGCTRKYWLSYRSEAIVTYSLCGFANLSSMGIVLGGMSAMAPSKQSTMTKLIVRALMVGCFVSLSNAAIFGFLNNTESLVPAEGFVNCTTYNNAVTKIQGNFSEEFCIDQSKKSCCLLDEQYQTTYCNMTLN